MNDSALTSGQRFVVLLLGLAVVVVFAMVAGFVVTYRQMADNPPVATAPSSTAQPSLLPAITLTPSPVPVEPEGGEWSPVQAA